MFRHDIIFTLQNRQKVRFNNKGERIKMHCCNKSRNVQEQIRNNNQNNHIDIGANLVIPDDIRPNLIERIQNNERLKNNNDNEDIEIETQLPKYYGRYREYLDMSADRILRQVDDNPNFFWETAEGALRYFRSFSPQTRPQGGIYITEKKALSIMDIIDKIEKENAGYNQERLERCIFNRFRLRDNVRNYKQVADKLKCGEIVPDESDNEWCAQTFKDLHSYVYIPATAPKFGELTSFVINGEKKETSDDENKNRILMELSIQFLKLNKNLTPEILIGIFGENMWRLARNVKANIFTAKDLYDANKSILEVGKRVPQAIISDVRSERFKPTDYPLNEKQIHEAVTAHREFTPKQFIDARFNDINKNINDVNEIIRGFDPYKLSSIKGFKNAGISYEEIRDNSIFIRGVDDNCYYYYRDDMSNMDIKLQKIREKEEKGLRTKQNKADIKKAKLDIRNRSRVKEDLGKIKSLYKQIEKLYTAKSKGQMDAVEAQDAIEALRNQLIVLTGDDASGVGTEIDF